MADEIKPIDSKTMTPEQVQDEYNKAACFAGDLNYRISVFTENLKQAHLYMKTLNDRANELKKEEAK